MATKWVAVQRIYLGVKYWKKFRVLLVFTTIFTPEYFNSTASGEVCIYVYSIDTKWRGAPLIIYGVQA